MKTIALTFLLIACSTQQQPRVAVVDGGGNDGGSDAPPSSGQPLVYDLGSMTLTSFNFGNAVANDASVGLALTVTNDTDQVTGELDVSMGGADPSQFLIDPTSTCPDSLELAPSATCSMVVRFAPTAIGTANATLTTAADPGGSASLDLSGTGTTPPSITFSPPYYDFSTIEFGHPASQAFQLTNTGPDLMLQSIQLGAHLGSGFSIDPSSTCGGVLAAGDSCQLVVDFAPTTFGQDSGELTITTDLGQVVEGANWVMGYGAARLTIASTGLGSGEVTSDGGGNPDVDCEVTGGGAQSGACSGLFVDAQHAVTASAAPGSAFAGFTGGGCSTSPCSVTLGTSATIVTTNFGIAP